MMFVIMLTSFLLRCFLIRVFCFFGYFFGRDCDAADCSCQLYTRDFDGFHLTGCHALTLECCYLIALGVFDYDTALAEDGTYTEEYFQCLGIGVYEAVKMDMLGYCVTYHVAVYNLQYAAGISACISLRCAISVCRTFAASCFVLCYICSCVSAGFGCFSCYVVYQVMYMENIAAGKYAGKGGFHVLEYLGAVGAGVNLDAGAAGKLIFGDQTYGEEDCIAVEFHLCARNRAAVLIYLSYDDFLYTVLALNINDGMGQIKGYVKVMQTLYNITGQAA